MKIIRSLRLLVLALFVSLIPASSFAGVFISVNFAPPILPVYDQPPCPEPGLMWTPGYWAYGEDGYYWVPGTWVPVPYEGAFWTPPYWGWDGGLYMFHPGYWGPHVGYYGGVNYGFGYMGIGFVGGMWRGHDFVYNTAVMRVDERYVHTTYVDRTIVERNTIVNDRHVAFSGGPGGIRHDPMPEERFAQRDPHTQATLFQQSHESAAMSDRSSYVKNNGGRPSNLAVQRPMGNGMQGTPAGRSKSGSDAWSAPARTQQNQGGGAYQGGANQGRSNYNNPQTNRANPNNGSYNNSRPNNGNGDQRNFNNSHSNAGNAPAQPAPQPHPAPEFRQSPQPQPRQMQQPQPRPQPEMQARPQPQMRPAPPPQPHPAPEQHGQGQNNGDHKDHQH